MRFAASPLMVAVALGLLGPSVLEAEDEISEDHAGEADAPAAQDLPSEAFEGDR
jgi:hypothetical protein